MRAWTFSQRGEPSKVLSLTDLPAPTIPSTTSEEWILVKVAFAGLNVGSVFQMTLIPAFLRAKTCVPEMDLSGTVVEASASSQDAVVQRFQRGDKIVAMLPASHSLSTGTGALAEYVAIPAQYAVKKPPHVSFADGAGCLLTGMTAYQQVKESEIKPGDRVLVNAASGGIGSIVVQMAKKIVGSNGYVVGVCSGRNAQAVKDLGADEVVDYTQHKDVSAHLASRFGSSQFDAAIDSLGFQAIYTASPGYLRAGGIYSSVGVKPPSFAVPDFFRAVWQMKMNEWWPVSPWLFGAGRLWRGVSMMSPTLEDRQRIVDMVGSGEVRVLRDSVWDFERVQEAYAKVEGRHARGKVMVKVDKHIADDAC